MLKKTILSFLCAMLAWAAMAQEVTVLKFNEEIFDFGIVQEEGGAVMHEFVFTNNGNRPVKILGVQASCGCTTPAWSKEAIPPGKTGFIQASFNPKGRPGFFNKSLTVTTDLDANPLTLQIKGQVSSGSSSSPTEFGAEAGSWRLRTLSLNMGKVLIRDEAMVKEFPLMNQGKKAVSFTGKVTAPAYIKAEVDPALLVPGAKGVIRIRYYGKLKNLYGFQSDNIQLHTDDEAMPVKAFTVYATLEDYFPPLSPEAKAKAPKISLSANSLVLGNVKQDAQVIRDITVSNVGRQELALKSLQPNCTCVTAQADKATLKPGESTLLHITFNPEKRTGTQRKAVTLYTNDPQTPVLLIPVSVVVE